MNLNELLADLEQSAGLEKTAGVKSEKAVSPAIKAELASVLEKKAEQDLTKVAFEEGSALAKMLLEKLANEIQVDNSIMEAEDATKVTPNSTGTIEDSLKETVEKAVARGAESDDRVDPVIDKEASLLKQSQENKTMAKSIMSKLAQMVGETPTTPAAGENIAPGTVPNMIQAENAGMTAFDDAKVTALPGAEGTINNILEALVAKAKAEGAGSDNLVDGVGATEGAVALGSPEDEVEKAAAVNALVGEGMDFDTAVNLVKQAEEELVGEAKEQEKVAAVNALAEAGYDFDTAVELVKQAEYELAQEEDAMEKMAAVEELMGQGYDFDSAVELIKQAEEEHRKATTGDAVKLHAKVLGRSLLEGAGGTIAGGALGAGAGLLALKTKTGAKMIAKLKKYAPKNPTITRAQERKGMAVGLGVAAGGLVGGNVGAVHGTIKSTKNSLDRQREKKAALEALVAEGIDFDTAFDLVKQAELEVYGE